ncbi:tetraspanin-19-like [Hibiscus syriacus]|uniref:tetraspanin-19-like n=1 Tax=Hibiscus syriacus TaxID=106335 RepID=UPI001920FE47|nr:tetraspanin-19-like [Hibiscus syriacus]
MARCSWCCLHYSLKTVNLIMTFLGIAMIVYSLWLQKMWNLGAAQLPSYPSLRKPWFVYTCLGVGMALCLRTLFGYIVANCINSNILCFYIISICSLLFLEVAVIVTIFFKYDWFSLFSKYIDERHEDFKTFIVFHEEICQLIAILILSPQVSVVALAIVLWSVGIERISERRHLEIPDFTTSFLVGTGSAFLNHTTLICGRCEVLRTGNPTTQGLFSYIMMTLRMQFQTRPIKFCYNNNTNVLNH